MKADPPIVDFYYAIPSRYSYLASTQLAAVGARTGCRFRWIPVSTQRLMAARGGNPFAGEPISGQYEWSYREQDAKRWAAFYGVLFREPRGRIDYDPETIALAATAASTLGAAETYSRQLFAALFVDKLDSIGEGDCVERARRCGLDANRFRALCAEPATAAVLDQHVRDAVHAGVFGVPSFAIAGEVYWGNDRLRLLEHALAGNSGAIHQSER